MRGCLRSERVGSDKDGNTDPAGAIPAKIEANGYKAYKYVDHEKLGKWIEDAAKAAGK